MHNTNSNPVIAILFRLLFSVCLYLNRIISFSLFFFTKRIPAIVPYATASHQPSARLMVFFPGGQRKAIDQFPSSCSAAKEQIKVFPLPDQIAIDPRSHSPVKLSHCRSHHHHRSSKQARKKDTICPLPPPPTKHSSIFFPVAPRLLYEYSTYGSMWPQQTFDIDI